MKRYMNKLRVFSVVTFALGACLHGKAQQLKSVDFQNNSLNIESFNNDLNPSSKLPLVSFIMDKDTINGVKLELKDGSAEVKNKIQLSWKPIEYNKGIKGEVTFKNVSGDTISIKNVVPFGKNPSSVYITGKGNHGLSRTHLFRPGYLPVNVIVPDNAWELGYSGNLVIKRQICMCSYQKDRDRKRCKKKV